LYLPHQVCLLLALEKALAYLKICPFALNYESAMLYSTGPSIYVKDTFSEFNFPVLKKIQYSEVM